MTTPWHGRVVAGVDGFAPSERPVDVAAVEAATRGMPLHMICAYDGEQASGRTRSGAPATRLSAGEARRRVAAAAEWVGGTRAGLIVSTAVIAGDPASVLTNESRSDDLVAVGYRGRVGFAGSVAAEVSSRAPCPVIITTSDVDSGSRGPIVVAVKDCDRDASAISFAIDEAAVRGVPLRAVHVWLNIPDMELASVDPFVYDLAEARRDASRLIRDALDGWPQRYPHVKVQRVPMYRVDVAAAIGEASADASLVVLGAPGANVGLLGSVIEQSRCPVAAVHRPERRSLDGRSEAGAAFARRWQFQRRGIRRHTTHGRKP